MSFDDHHVPDEWECPKCEHANKIDDLTRPNKTCSKCGHVIETWEVDGLTILAKRTKQPTGLMLLPPAKDKCQECAVAHKPEEPHDATSMFYHVHFQIRHQRGPGWADAMEHCSEPVKAAWTKALAGRGITDLKQVASLRWKREAKEQGSDVAEKKTQASL